jgi:spermidine synthase
LNLPPAGRAALRRTLPATLYFLSGATGLCYEVLWSRMLAFQFGVSIFGVAVTVAAFLAGLGAGAFLAQRLLRRAGAVQALRVFGALEGAVGAYALALPGLRALAAPLLDGWGASLAAGQWRLLQGACAALLLALPAAAMGAAFPAMLRALPPSPGLVGRVYGWNCLGAAVGALAALALLAGLGWDEALRAVAALSALLAAGAWGLARADAAPGAREPAGSDVAGARSPSYSELLLYAGVGACALFLEIAWTRLYGMVLLRTEYVLALILAVYLAGSAIGSLLAARPRPWMRSAVALAAGTGPLAALAILPALSRWIQQREFDSLMGALAVDAIALAACTFPTTLALGAWLPLLAAGPTEAGGAEAPPASVGAARLYAANCLGAALGAVAAVALAIPLLGTTATVCLAALGLLALGGCLAPWRIVVAALPLAAAGAWAVHEWPAPQALLAPSAQIGRELDRYEDALSLHQVVEGADGQRTLLADLQRMDASTDAAAVQIQRDQARLPLLLHPAPRSILFLGLGTGIAAGGSLPFPDLERSAVEISPGAVNAARRWFATANGGVMRDLHVDVDDARHYLMASRQRFDVIVGDLFHPDLAGMSNLLSVEQFGRARAHLAPGGIFVQWLALNQFDSPSLDIVLRAFRQAFPGGVRFFDGMHLALVGTSGTAPWAAGLERRAPGAALEEQSGGEGAWTWLGRYCGPVGGGEGPVQGETRPLIEYRLPRLRYQEGPLLRGLLDRLLRERPSADAAAAELGVARAHRGEFTDAYVAAGLAMQGWLAALDGDAARAGERLQLSYEANPRDRWVASALADAVLDRAASDGALGERSVLERALRIDPAHVEAWRALWHLDRGDPAAARQDLARLRELVPLDREVAAAQDP